MFSTKFYIDKKDDIVVKNILQDAFVDFHRVEFIKNIRYIVRQKKKDDKNLMPDTLSEFFNLFKTE